MISSSCFLQDGIFFWKFTLYIQILQETKTNLEYSEWKNQKDLYISPHYCLTSVFPVSFFLFCNLTLSDKCILPGESKLIQTKLVYRQNESIKKLLHFR